ncbi:hypothetical protein ACVWWQ_002252 [Rhodanobacter sp. TND4EL1]
MRHPQERTLCAMPLDDVPKSTVHSVRSCKITSPHAVASPVMLFLRWRRWTTRL